MKTSAKKAATATKKAAPRAKKAATPARKTATKAAARKGPPPRADYGKPVDGFFAKQPPDLRPVLDALRKLVEEAAPDATGALKWGMPFYTLGGEMMCALAGFKSHVNLILPGPTGTYADPDGRLDGESKNGKHLKLRSLDELPRDTVRGWLRVAAKRARAGGRPS